MVEKELVVAIKDGLHARPAAEFVTGLRDFSSSVEICISQRSYNGKSILGLMSAAIRQGQKIMIKTEGPDEMETMNWVAQFLTKE